MVFGVVECWIGELFEDEDVDVIIFEILGIGVTGVDGGNGEITCDDDDDDDEEEEEDDDGFTWRPIRFCGE